MSRPALDSKRHETRTIPSASFPLLEATERWYDQVQQQNLNLYRNSYVLSYGAADGDC